MLRPGAKSDRGPRPARRAPARAPLRFSLGGRGGDFAMDSGESGAEASFSFCAWLPGKICSNCPFGGLGRAPFSRPCPGRLRGPPASPMLSWSHWRRQLAYLHPARGPRCRPSIGAPSQRLIGHALSPGFWSFRLGLSAGQCLEPRGQNPLWSSWLGYSALTQATRVRVPVAEVFRKAPEAFYISRIARAILAQGPCQSSIG